VYLIRESILIIPVIQFFPGAISSTFLMEGLFTATDLLQTATSGVFEVVVLLEKPKKIPGNIFLSAPIIAVVTVEISIGLQVIVGEVL
jgi:hypothetical protein